MVVFDNNADIDSEQKQKLRYYDAKNLIQFCSATGPFFYKALTDSPVFSIVWHIVFILSH